MAKSHCYFWLDIRRPIGGSNYPLKIVVNHQGQSYISTGCVFTELQWKIIQDRTIRKHHLFDTRYDSNDSEAVLAGIRRIIDDKLKKVDDTLDELVKKGTPFKASDVKDKLNATVYNTSQLQYIYNCHEEYIHKLKESNKSPKTIDGYKSSFSVLRNYYQSISKRNRIENLRLVQIDVAFLRKYEKYLESKGDSISTISAHHRYIRALFNYAIRKNGVPKDAYPYGRGDNHISIKAVRKTKKALKTEEIKALLDYRRTSMPPKQWRNVDLAMLSFMLNGANMLDIAQLTYKDNYDAGSKTIHFIRQKTFNETSTLTEINIPITKGINWMIKQYGNSNNPNNYIFNILRPVDNTPERIRRRVHDITRAIDKTLKRVAKKCGIREDISFQFFRHTHATFIIKNGCEIYDVMVSMGHRDIKTTQLYISSLPEDEPEFSKKKQELLQGVYE